MTLNSKINDLRVLVVYAISLIFGCASANVDRPPSITLQIPPAFNYNSKLREYKIGDYLLNSPPYVKQAAFPMTKFSGSWGPPTGAQSTEHFWQIWVSLQNPTKVLEAYNRAKDGYDANVDEDDNYMFARFAKKSFPWGKGFSYFTQFTQDTGIYVPHNGHLTYEVWGLTNDLKHVVHARCTVTHPSLASWGPEVRDVPSMNDLKVDRDYKLIESCSPVDFSPQLTELDKLIGSIRLK